MAKAEKGPAAIVESAGRFAAGFREFSAGQKAVVIAVLVALIGGGLAFTRWAATPTYAPLFSSLSGSDASAMVEKLKADGTPYQLTDGGTTILVPQDQVYDTRLEMSGEGLPSDTESGYALLEQSGVTTSEFMQQKTYQRALSDELATTIEAISGVDTAVVNLAIPKKDVFLDEQDPTTASVLVGLKPGASLSSDQVTSIVNLVAGGVEGMDPENVSVVDDKGNTLSADATGTSAQQEEARDYNTAASANLQSLLEGVFGKGNVKATVNATLNFDDRTETATRYQDPNIAKPLAGSSSEETYTGGAGNPASGVLGPDNIQVPAGQAADSQYSKRSSTDNNAIDRTDTVTKSAPGKVERQSVAVVLDATKAGTADVAQVEQIVRNAAGVVDGRDTVSVVKTAFDASAEDEAARALAEAKAQEQRDRYLTYGKTAALALLVMIMLVVVLVSFRRRKAEEQEVVEVPAMPIDLGDITDQVVDPQPEIVTPQPLVLEPAPVDPALEAAAARRDEVVELVSRQPQEVAELLRGWLADRRS